MKHFILIFALLSRLTTGVIGQSPVFFAKDSYTLTVMAKEKLRKLASDIKKQGEMRPLILTGHTDDDADEDYNKNLSLKRAMAVKEYLEENGLRNRFDIISKGESEPINDNKDETQKSKNRRVEIAFANPPDNTFLEALRPEVQQFNITPLEDTTILCKEGTKVFLGKNCFAGIDIEKPIEITVQEYYDKSACIAAHLSTMTTTEQLLESKGMIYIEASQNGQPLHLSQDQTVDILFKDRSAGDSTTVFYGQTENDQIVWTEAQGNSPKITPNSRGWDKWYIGDNIYKEDKWQYGNVNGKQVKITRTIWYKLKNGKRKPVQHQDISWNTDSITYDTVDITSRNMMNNLVLSSERLGWINCDRFYNTKAPKSDLIVEYPDSLVPDITLIFTDIRAVLSYSYRIDNKVVFNNIPAGMKIKLVGLYRSGDSDQVFFANKSGTTQSNSSTRLQFSLLSNAEVKNQMRHL